MVGCGDHDQRVIQERLRADVQAVGRLPQDGQVGAVVGELLQDGVAVGDLQDHIDVGIALAKPGEQLRGEVVGGVDHRNRQLAMAQPFHFIEHRLHFGELLGDVAAVLEQFAPGLGEKDLLAHLLEQRQADAFLELLDLHRHGRL